MMPVDFYYMLAIDQSYNGLEQLLSMVKKTLP
jgi:hypothetical protein